MHLPLVGNRLVLRKFRESDINDDYIAWLNDKKLMKFSRHRHEDHSPESCRTYHSTFLGSGNYFLAIVDASSGVLVGTLTVYINQFGKSADLGILLGNPIFRGRGYADEAWKLAVNHLLEEVGIQKVTAGTLSENLSMIRIILGSGMILESIKKAPQELAASGPLDVLYFSRTAN